MVGELIDGLGDECPTSVGAARQQHGASWDLKRFKDPPAHQAALLLMGLLKSFYIMLRMPFN